MSNTEANWDGFFWHEIESPRWMGQMRMAAKRRFFDDLPTGQGAGHYRAEALPSLPFADRVFVLALCSDLLFTSSDQLSKYFHVVTIEEMRRVAREARVFSLLESYGDTSLFLEPVISTLRQREYAVRKRQVPRIWYYAFQLGGNRMLVASRKRAESSGA